MLAPQVWSCPEPVFYRHLYCLPPIYLPINHSRLVHGINIAHVAPLTSPTSSHRGSSGGPRAGAAAAAIRPILQQRDSGCSWDASMPLSTLGGASPPDYDVGPPLLGCTASALPALQNMMLMSLSTMDLDEYDASCGVCFDAGDFLATQPCNHKICTACASELLKLHPCDPVPCPFCRCLLRGFSEYRRAGKEA